MQIQNNNQAVFGFRHVARGDLSALSKPLIRSVDGVQSFARILGDDNTNLEFVDASSMISGKKGLLVIASEADSPATKNIKSSKWVPNGTAIGYPRTENGVIKLVKQAFRDLEKKRKITSA